MKYNIEVEFGLSKFGLVSYDTCQGCMWFLIGIS